MSRGIGQDGTMRRRAAATATHTADGGVENRRRRTPRDEQTLDVRSGNRRRLTHP